MVYLIDIELDNFTLIGFLYVCTNFSMLISNHIHCTRIHNLEVYHLVESILDWHNVCIPSDPEITDYGFFVNLDILKRFSNERIVYSISFLVVEYIP
jgi:hypothetical protein